MDGQHTARDRNVLANTATRRAFVGGGLGGLLLALGLSPRLAPVFAAESTTAGVAEAINAYRQTKGLPAIPVADEMTQVAKAHVADLVAHNPEDACNGNLHSWSANGNWSSGCYDPNNDATWPMMWDKPKEIANYPGRGYEISASGTPSISADQALALWQGSTGHNAVILEEGIWAGMAWGALGGWAADGHACAWFGVEPGTAPKDPPVVIPPTEGGNGGAEPPKDGETGTAPKPPEEMPGEKPGENTGDKPNGETDPATPDDGERTDSDNDDLYDDDETDIYNTDPNNPDSDGDGYDDGQEVYDGTDPNDPDDYLDPASRTDTDNDGLYDGDETGFYGTDPDNPDTDGDGYDDGQEVFDGTNPNDPEDYLEA